MKRIFLLSVIFSFICFGSCKYNLIDKPTPEPDVTLNASDYDDNISAPENLTASQGKYREVSLSWTLLPNAVQYQVFESESPFSNFIQIAETPDNTNSITVTDKSGISKYYYVKAVNYYGTISSPSNIAFGTTMATPIITNITCDENQPDVTVTWWMDNCTDSTYQDSTNFIIRCFDEDKKTEIATKNAEKNAREITFENLQAHKNYFYQVESFLTSYQDKIEKSDMVDAQTARRLVPNAPVNFTVTKGISTSEIDLSWELPDYVDFALGNNAFVPHPVYFTIERKKSDADDSTYVKLVSYIGCVSQNPNSQIITFNCSTLSTSNENLIITQDGEQGNELYPDYHPGAKLTYKDKSVEQGKKYTYRISSYTDDSTKAISSDNSVTKAEGWLISPITFRYNITYDFDNPEDQDSAINEATVDFSTVFEDFGLEYTYILTEMYSETSPNNPLSDETQLQIFNTLEDIKTYTRIYPCTEAINKYYRYKLYVVEKGLTDFNDYYTVSVPYDSKIVTNSRVNLPLSNFSVKEGFKDKFELSWNYRSGYSYSYKMYDENENPAMADVIPIPEDKITVLDSTATYSVPAQSGDNKKFTIIATQTSTQNMGEIGLSETFHTLGTPSPVLSSYDYDNITVTWPKVYCAKDNPEDFVVSAFYTDDLTNNLVTSENINITKDLDNNYTCVISKPSGYNDVNKSGKPITLHITAESESTGDKTTSTTSVRTLGPATLSPSIGEKYGNAIEFIWNEFDSSISKYMVYRTKYSLSDFNKIDQTDTYIVEKSAGGICSVSVNEEPVTSEKVSVVYDASTKKFKLDDYVINNNDLTDSYKNNQSQIDWGIPFGYVVLPIKGDKDFSFESRKLITTNTSVVDYSAASNISDIKGSTFGYGFNVTAEKAMDTKNQTISWNKPYNTNNTLPTVYRRECGSTGGWSEVTNANTSNNSTQVSFVIADSDVTKAYDYLVKYNKKGGLTPSASFVATFDSYKDSNSPTENLNKGYLLNIAPHASNGNIPNDTSATTYYREKFTWEIWDYSKRAIGPDSIDIYLLNKNKKDGWKKVISLDKNCSPISSTDQTLNGNLSDVYLEGTPGQIYLAPKNIRNGTSQYTTGDLNVLRDTKHYYKIVLKRSGLEDKVVGEDESIYIHRNITDEEFIKCINLIIADALNHSGIDSGGSRNYNDFYIKHTGGTKTLTWGTGGKDYKHKFTSGLNSTEASSPSIQPFISEFSINIDNIESRRAVTKSELYYIPLTTITVKHPVYGTKIMTINIGEQGHDGWTPVSDGVKESWIGTWTLNGNTIHSIKSSNKTEFLQWFPFEIAKDHDDEITKYNSNEPEYKSPWWN